jgi:hypothetical protein
MILFVVFAFMVQSLVIVQRIAWVDNLAGKVEYQRRGKGAWHTLTDKTHLQTNDVVRTIGASSSAELYWLDGTRIRLAPNTTMRIKKSTRNLMKHAETSLFRLDLGKVWVRVVRSLRRSSQFAVETPTAVATVRGTIFSVAVQPEGSTKVSVYDGTVEVVGSAASISVPRGRYAHVSLPNVAPEVKAISPDEAQDWKKQIGIVTPALNIVEPEDRIQTSHAMIEMSGFVEPGATLLVNGQPVRVNPSTKEFTKIVRLKPGHNDIIFVVKDRRGAETKVVRTVVRTTSDQATHSS